MNRDFSVNGQEFKLGKIDAFKQFHIVRRIAPIMADLLPAMKEMSSAKTESLTEDQKLESAAKIFAPIMVGLSRLSDSDADRVLYGLLESVEIKQGAGWARIASGNTLMFHNLDLAVLLQVAGRAFAFNLSGFIGALPQAS